MNTITLQEAQTNLADWVARLRPGEELSISQAGKPIARLIAGQNSVRLEGSENSPLEEEEVAVLDEAACSEEARLLQRITRNPKIFGGKPIVRGKRLAVEHVLGMLAWGETSETLLEEYPWLERDDIRACILYALRQMEDDPSRGPAAEMPKSP